MGKDVRYGLIVEFPDDSSSFVHGVEAGILNEQMESGAVSEIEKTVHTENKEVLRRMAVAYGWEISFQPTEVEGWQIVKLKKTKKITQKPNPKGIRIVR